MSENEEDEVCRTQFGSMHEKIREVFLTSFIFRCEAYKNLTVYNDVFLDPAILKLLKNDDVVKTAKIFLENDLNLTQASKTCFLHRNTLIYRIKRIKTIMGLDIRKFEDAVCFANMLELYKNFV